MANTPTPNKSINKVAKPNAALADPAAGAPAVTKAVLPAQPPFADIPAESTVAAPPMTAVLPGASAAIDTPKIDIPAIETSKVEIASTKTKTPVAADAAAATALKGPLMNDTLNNAQATINDAQATIKTAAEDMQVRATEMFGDVNARAKEAMAKGSKAIEELVEFSKGNVEAIVASGRVAAKGAEEIAKYSAEYGRTAVEKANATAKQFAAVKSPTEFFQLQGEVAKQTLDALVAEGSKFTENYLKLMGEISQPISNRVAVAAEKVKSNVTA